MCQGIPRVRQQTMLWLLCEYPALHRQYFMANDNERLAMANSDTNFAAGQHSVAKESEYSHIIL